MKRYILISIISLLAALQLPAQILIKSNSDTLTFNASNPITKIIFQQADTVTFALSDGKTFQIDFTALDKMFFAKDAATGINDIKAGEEAIVYDAAAQVVYVVNGKSTASIVLFSAEGKRLRMAKGSHLSLTGLPSGLYVVSYNGVLNAKILKK